MKKFLLGLLMFVVVIGGAGWLFRIEILLSLVKYKAEQQFTLAENRTIDWQSGPQTQTPMRTGDSSQAPNIIFIMLDDVGINDISAFGGGMAGGSFKTPNIDALATEGVSFTQSYAGNATCAPSRGMAMTGRYPTRTGYEFTPFPGGQTILSTVIDSLSNGLPPAILNKSADEAALPYEEQGLPSSEVTLAEMLKGNGYHTVHIGKWHMGRENGMAPNDQGFDESLLMHSGLYLPEDDPNVVNAKLDFDPIDKFLWARLRYSASYNDASYDDPFKPGGYLTDYWTDESIKVIKANKDRPFFLYLAHWGTHTPLQATKADYEAVGDIKPHRARVYAAMMLAIDRSVGRIQKALEEEGLAENTIIALTSDNGGAGYIGLPDVNAPYRGWKLTFFEGGIRVPMFIKWPNKIKAGSTVDTPMSHIDIMPTLAAAVGAPLPNGIEIDGVNLMPSIRKGHVLANRPLFWQSDHYKAVRYGDWKLQISDIPNKKWLYNLRIDPTEQNNLSDKQEGKLAELLALLKKHEQGRYPALYPSTMQAPVAIDQAKHVPFKKGAEYIYWPN